MGAWSFIGVVRAIWFPLDGLEIDQRGLAKTHRPLGMDSFHFSDTIFQLGAQHAVFAADLSCFMFDFSLGNFQALGKRRRNRKENHTLPL